MNINVYLPDHIGQRAKDAELPLSRLLRDAVLEELARRSPRQWNGIAWSAEFAAPVRPAPPSVIHTGPQT